MSARRVVMTALTLMSGCGGRRGQADPTPPPASPTKVLCYGDSITGGTGVTTPYPTTLGTLLGSGFEVTNGGMSGARFADLMGFYVSQRAGQGFKRCVVLAGVNDLMKDTGFLATDTLVYATTLINNIIADGCTPLVMLPTPVGGATGSFAGSSSKNAEYASFRTLLASLCTSMGITYVDTYPTMGDSSSPVQLLPAMFGDGVHPSQAGANQLAALAYGLINP